MKSGLILPSLAVASRLFIMVLMNIAISCFAIESNDIKIMSSAPLMGLSADLPVSLSRDNKRTYIDENSILEQQLFENIKLVNQRSIPWLSILASIVVIGTIILIVKIPYKERQPDIDLLKVLKLEAIKEVEFLSKLDPKKIENRNDCFFQLDDAIRKYCKGGFQIDAPTLTTQEIIKEIVDSSTIDERAKSHLFLFFKTGQNIKYGKYSPSSDELSSIFKEAISVVQRSN